MKTCYFCKGEVVEKRIQHVHQWDEKTVIFEDVPAEVCHQCGEVFLARGVGEDGCGDEGNMEEMKP